MSNHDMIKHPVSWNRVKKSGLVQAISQMSTRVRSKDYYPNCQTGIYRPDEFRGELKEKFDEGRDQNKLIKYIEDIENACYRNQFNLALEFLYGMRTYVLFAGAHYGQIHTEYSRYTGKLGYSSTGILGVIFGDINSIIGLLCFPLPDIKIGDLYKGEDGRILYVENIYTTAAGVWFELHDIHYDHHWADGFLWNTAYHVLQGSPIHDAGLWFRDNMTKMN